MHRARKAAGRSRGEDEAREADESLTSSELAANENKKQKSRRPPNTAFRQQRLKAWQPILTPKTVLPLFFAVGIIFAPIGALLLWANSQVQEISIDYSRCAMDAGVQDFTDIPTSNVRKNFKSSQSMGPARWKRVLNQTVKYNDSDTEVANTTVCHLQFPIDSDLVPPVLLYYTLTNFYQNHRRYVKSFDANQLAGQARTAQEVNSSDCEPIRTDNVTRKPFYPCGLIANSLFNDTFGDPVMLNTNVTYEMSDTGIAWNSDRALYKPTAYNNSQAVPPPNWVRKWNYTHKMPDLSTDEPFQVWMRTAGLPQFSKLALRADQAVMQKGLYEIAIYDEFNTTLYGGTKSMLISTRTVMGGRNPFLGIAYIVVGGICIIMGAIFTGTHLIKPRKLGDHTYLSWEKDSSARTTGRSARAGETNPT